MQKMMKRADWNLLRAFHMTATTGSLSAAARELGLTQPTLSRQVNGLEQTLGVVLFERQGKKLVLTRHGRELLEYASAMNEAAQSVLMSANGHAQITGRVCISATDSMSTYVMPEIFDILRQEAPGVSLVLDVDNAQTNLNQMEADIAIRHAKPDQPELVGEFVCETEAYFFASKDWVKRHGLPAKPSDLKGEHLIGFGDVEQLAGHLSSLGFRVGGKDFKLASNSATAAWEMVKRGLGVAAMSKEVARRSPEVVQLFPTEAAIRVPIWAVTHRAMQSSPRVRLVQDILVRELTRVNAI